MPRRRIPKKKEWPPDFPPEVAGDYKELGLTEHEEHYFDHADKVMKMCQGQSPTFVLTFQSVILVQQFLRKIERTERDFIFEDLTLDELYNLLAPLRRPKS